VRRPASCSAKNVAGVFACATYTIYILTFMVVVVVVVVVMGVMMLRNSRGGPTTAITGAVPVEVLYLLVDDVGPGRMRAGSSSLAPTRALVNGRDSASTDRHPTSYDSPYRHVQL